MLWTFPEGRAQIHKSFALSSVSEWSDAHIELEVEVGGVKKGGKMCPVSLSGSVSVLMYTWGYF